MGSKRSIEKIGLATFRSGKILLARKRGSSTFILPGGKPESEETKEDALVREIFEELACGVSSIAPLGSFTAQAAYDPGSTVTVHLYSGDLDGEPTPSSEIEEIRYVSLRDYRGIRLAESLTLKIFPFLLQEVDLVHDKKSE